MRFCRYPIAAFLLLKSLCGAAYADSAQEVADRYQMDVDAQSGIVRVRAHLGDIRANEICCMPAFGQRIGERLSQPLIVDAQNQAVAVSFDDSGCFSTASALSDVWVAYDLTISPLPANRFWVASALSPLHRDGTIAIPGESLFIERDARKSGGIGRRTTVEVRNVGDIQVVSTLLPDDASAGGTLAFTAPNKYALVRSFWTFGAQRILTASSGRMSFILSVAAGVTFPIETVERELIAILDAYDSWLGGKTPAHVSIFLFAAPHDADYRHGFARHGGFIVQLGRNAVSDGAARRILLAHELFHLYNGEGLQYDADDYHGTAWMREGMTQYLALKTLLGLGLLRQNDIYRWMGQSIERNTSSGQIIAGNSSENAYHRGYFLSLAIEQQWARFNTGLSLENYWRYLAQTDAWQVAQTNRHLQKSLELYSGFDFSDFFRRYVYGSEPVPVKEILRMAGLCVVRRLYTTWSAGMSYRYEATDATLRVDRVDARGSAKQAGLRVGDVLVPQPDTSWQDNRDKQIGVIRKDKQLQMRIPVLQITANGVDVGPCG